MGLRMSGKDLFVCYHKGIEVWGCTNKRILAKKTGIDYNTLMRIFTRQGKCYYEDDKIIILKVRTERIEKGMQSISRKGKGGMERFRDRYLMGKRESY